MTFSHLPTDILPYTVECNACAARFNRMIDYDEHVAATHADQSANPVSPQVDDDAIWRHVSGDFGRVRLPLYIRARGVRVRPRRDQPLAQDASDGPSTASDPIQCQWKGCDSTFDGADANKELYKHLNDHYQPGQKSIPCQWAGCTVKPQRDTFYMRLHLQKHAPVGGVLTCNGGCGQRFTTANQKTVHHKVCPLLQQRRESDGEQQ